MHGIKKYRLNIFKDEYERKCLVQEKNLKNQNMFEIVCYVSLSHIDKVLFLRTTKIYLFRLKPLHHMLEFNLHVQRWAINHFVP